MTQITGGEAVIRALKAEGVDVVFGLPGVHALPIFDALYHHPEIRHIAVRHEQTAAYMADGYARVTGKPGVCITTTGPGSANTVAAMGTSYNDSIPVLNIMSQIQSDMVDKGKGIFHEAKDQLGMFKACTRWATRVSTQEDVPTAIHEAFVRMKTEHPGPTSIEFCTDILLNPVDIELYKFEENVQYTKAKANPTKVRQAVEMLRNAKSPLIWAGGGVGMADASDEVRRLAELLKAPVVTTNRGKGAIPEDHPLSVGTRSMEPAVFQMIQEADVLLAVGTRFGHGTTQNWSLKLPQNLIQIDIDEKTIGYNVPVGLGLVGDAKAVVSQLLESLDGGAADRPSPADLIAKIKKESQETIRSAAPEETQFWEDLCSVLPRDAIIVGDVTKPNGWTWRGIPVHQVRSVLSPAGYGSLGYAFPASLGAKVGAPDRTVVVVAGDGGFQYALPELATAMQFGINVTVLLFNDKRWSTLKDIQDRAYGSRYYQVDLYNPDFVKVAEAYGANGIRVNSFKEFKPAIEKALAFDKVTIVEIPMEFDRPWGGMPRR